MCQNKYNASDRNCRESFGNYKKRDAERSISPQPLLKQSSPAYSDKLTSRDRKGARRPPRLRSGLVESCHTTSEKCSKWYDDARTSRCARTMSKTTAKKRGAMGADNY